MPTDQPKRSIFRASAWERYQRRAEKEVLPRLIGPRSWLFLWIMLGLLVASGGLAWISRVPVYTTGPGIVTDDQSRAGTQALVLIFLTPDQLSRVQVGQTVDLLTPGTTGSRVSGQVEAIAPEILSPAEARRRYHLDGSATVVITQPSAVVSVRPGSNFPAAQYQGSLLAARIEVGSQPVLTLLPIFEQLNGK